MGKKNKFEKLGVNEEYYLTHNEQNPKEKKEKKKLFSSIGKKAKTVAKAIELDTENVPEKKYEPKKFFFTRTKVVYTENDQTEPSVLEEPSKAPFVLCLCVAVLLIICSVVTSSNLFASIGKKTAFWLIAAFSVLCYIVPSAVYIVSKKERRHAYYFKSFSGSFVPIMTAGLLFCICVCALQRYFIAYTFSYSVPQTQGYDGITSALLLGALMPAICEELLTRGILQHEFSRYGGGITGIIVSALVFSIIHFDLQYFMIYLTAGLVLGTVTHITGSVFPAMIIHFLNNTITILLSDKMVFVATERIGGRFLMIILAVLSFMFLIILLQMIEKLCIKRAVLYTNEDESDAKKPSFDETALLYSASGKTYRRFLKVLLDKRMLALYLVFVVTVIIKLVF